jgi:hypothetical protein
MDFNGLWRVVSSPDFDDAYMRMQVEPYIDLEHEGNRVSGEYHVGLQSGGVDGKVLKDGTVSFSFEGNDEMEEVNGRGTIILDDERLTFTLDYHFGDTFTFLCVRTAQE